MANLSNLFPLFIGMLILALLTDSLSYQPTNDEIELYKISEDLEELKQNDLFAEDGGSGGSSRNRQR